MTNDPTQRFATSLTPDGFLEFMFGSKTPSVPPTPEPETPPEDVLARLHRQINESAKHHSDAIRRDHETALRDMHRRHDSRLSGILVWGITTIALSGSHNNGSTFSNFQVVRVMGQDLYRIPYDKAQPTLDDFYINVPLILKLWFRQTTPGRFIRWITKGSK
jgi:hypothetical protein